MKIRYRGFRSDLGCSGEEECQIRVVGKVFKPNRLKVLAFNRILNGYFKLVKWYLNFNSKFKRFLHKTATKGLGLFNLNTALIQTAKDKIVEILKSFEKPGRMTAF